MTRRTGEGGVYGRAPLNPKITPPSPPPGRGATAGTGLDPHFIVARYAPVRCDRCRPPDGRGFGETPGRMGGTLREGGGVGCWVKWGGLSRGDGPHVEEKAGRETGHAASCVGGTGGKEVAKVGGVGGIPEPRGGPQPDTPPPSFPWGGPRRPHLPLLRAPLLLRDPTLGGGGVCVTPGLGGEDDGHGTPPKHPPLPTSLTPIHPPGGGGGSPRRHPQPRRSPKCRGAAAAAALARPGGPPLRLPIGPGAPEGGAGPGAGVEANGEGGSWGGRAHLGPLPHTPPPLVAHSPRSYGRGAVPPPSPPPPR